MKMLKNTSPPRSYDRVFCTYEMMNLSQSNDIMLKSNPLFTMFFKGGTVPVLVEKPFSVEIINSVLDMYSEELPISVLDPDTGLEIILRIPNMPIIGLTSQETPNHQRSLGFLPGTNNKADDYEAEERSNRPSFEPEALFLIDVDPRRLPQGVTNAWVIQVVDQKNEDLYIKLAKKLSAKFDDQTIIVTSAYSKRMPRDVGEAEKAPKTKKSSLPPVIILRTEEAK